MSDDDLLVRIGLTEKQYLASIARLEAQSKRAAKGAETAFAKQNRSFVRGARRADTAANAFARGGLKNISMQLSQVSQQGAVTGNYMQALSVQAADIGLAFGTAGVVIGALIPVLYGVAQGYLATEESARDLEDIMTDLTAAMSDFKSAQSSASQGPSAMIDEYGALADEAQRVLDIQRQIAAVRAQEAIRSATRGVAQGMGTAAAFGVDPEQIRLGEIAVEALTDSIVNLREQANAMNDTEQALAAERTIIQLEDQAVAINRLEAGFSDLGRMLGVTEDEAREVVARFADIEAADGPRAQAEAMQSLADYIFDASENLTDAEENGQALYDSLISAVQAALDFAAVDMTGPVRDAISAVDVLRQRLNDTRGGIIGQVDQDNPDFFDPRNEGGRSGQVPGSVLPRLPDRSPRISSSGRRSRGSGRGGGGGGVSPAAQKQAEYARTAQRYFEQTRTALERYNEELRTLALLNEKGFFAEHPEAYARAVQQVNEAFVETEFEAALRGINDISDAMAGAIVNGENMGEALRGVFRQIASDLISSGIQGLLMQSFGFGGGGPRKGGLLGGLFAGFFDKGGSIPSGQFGIAGEYGPEIVRGPAQVTSRASTARMLGQQSLHVTVEMLNSGNMQAFVRNQAGEVLAQSAPEIVGASVQATRRQIQNSGSFLGA